jgi:hypothetical protein
VEGRYDSARSLFHTLALTARDKKLRALIVNEKETGTQLVS